MMLWYSGENDIMMMLERCASIPKIAGSSPAVARHIIQPVQCGK